MIYLKPNFITPEERLQIRQQVLDLRPHWRSIQHTWYGLGDSAYTVQDLSKINQEIKSLLIEEFSWLHDRICAEITRQKNIPTELHPILPCPGFHISEIPIDHTPPTYHIDSNVQGFIPNVNIETVYSVLLLIERPTPGAWLDYLKDDKSRIFHYEYNAFHQWKGTLEHRVGGYKVLPGEHRITLQCHYYHDKEAGKNYLYF